MAWQPEHIDRLINRHGKAIAVVCTENALGACLAHELPDVLDQWLDAEAIPFSPKARAAGYSGLRAALRDGVDVPVVYLEPSTIRLRWYDLGRRTLGPWVWSYAEN